MNKLQLAAIAGLALVVGLFAERYMSGSGPAGATPVDSFSTAANPAPGVLTDLDGNPMSLDRWRGQVLLVNFWATWCAPCRQEIPLLQSTREARRGQGLEVIGVAVDEVGPVRAFRDEFGIEYPLLMAPRDVTALLEQYGNSVGGLPHSAVIDRDGAMVESHTGMVTEEQLNAMVGPYLEN